MGNSVNSVSRLSDGLKIKSENINLLRFLSALLVIFGHSFALTGGGLDPIVRLTNDICSCGGLAVAILFFLSGMYVTSSLKRSCADESKSAFGISWNFIKRRCDRIFPQLFIVVILTALVIGTAVTTLPVKEYLTSPATYKYLLNAVLVPVHKLPGVFELHPDTTVNGALWTMPVEFAAYCFLAAVAFFCLAIRKPKLMKLAHWAALVIAVAALTYFSIKDNHFMIRIFRPVSFFVIGTLFCDYSDKIRLNIPTGLIALALCIGGLFTPAVNYVLMLTLPYAIVSLCLKPKQLPSLGIFGKISYEMYLFGVPTQQVIVELSRLSATPLMLFALSAVADIILAIILYLTVERINKAIKNKKKKA